MNGNTWQVWLGSIVIAAIVAQIGRIVEKWSTRRGDVKKAEGEGKKAEGEGNKADAEAVKAEAEARQIVEDGVWRRASELIARAENACAKCEQERKQAEASFKSEREQMEQGFKAELERIERGFKKFIGVMDELAAQFADPADRAKVRIAIREAWETL